MNNLDYYKSLISDDEVINALVRESKAREGELEKTRVRPNMNFFQRTVSNMVSSNRRITSRQEQKIAEEKEKNKKYKPRKIISKKRTARELIHEILTSQTKFVRSSVFEDIHFNQKRNNITEQSDSGLNSSVTQQHTKIKINYESDKIPNVHSSSNLLIPSSDEEEEINKTTKNESLPKSPTVLADHPIQISSDDDTSNIVILDDRICNYKKKKCKRHHKLNKSKKNLKPK